MSGIGRSTIPPVLHSVGEIAVRSFAQDYVVEGRRFDGFLADGSDGRSVPGILVVHEGRGFTQHARDRACMLAELGYVAYAADYFGAPATSLDHAYRMMAPFAQDKGKFHRHGRAALDVLSAHPNVHPTRLGAIGFCWGGFAALELTCFEPLACAVGFHPGLSLGPLSRPEGIGASLLVCVGDRDPYVPMSDIGAFCDLMHDHAIDAQLLLLTGAPHSFTNPEPYAYETGTGGVGYDEKADRRSWAAMRNLFAERLPI